MARAYAGAAGTHVFFGMLSLAAGVAWMCLLYLYDPFIDSRTNKSFLASQPVWFSILLAAKIICGFWFFLTGAVGCCIKSRGCTEGVWVALNVLNVVIWSPALLLVEATLAYVLAIAPGLLSDFANDGGEELSNTFSSLMWLWLFPAIGLVVGIVEFILSIVSYSITCCCRPASLDDGYEYQYEMK